MTAEILATSNETSPAPPTASGSRKVVEFIYKPIFPRTGLVERATGALGHTKLETIQIIKEGFPSLGAFENERFELHIKNPAGEWSKVLDNGWELLREDPPGLWGILITDGPGDEELRKQKAKRSSRRNWIILGVIFLVYAYLRG